MQVYGRYKQKAKWTLISYSEISLEQQAWC